MIRYEKKLFFKGGAARKVLIKKGILLEEGLKKILKGGCLKMGRGVFSRGEGVETSKETMVFNSIQQFKNILSTSLYGCA